MEARLPSDLMVIYIFLLVIGGGDDVATDMALIRTLQMHAEKDRIITTI
jgi:hypothetical protein